MMQGSKAFSDEEIKEKQNQIFPLDQMSYFTDEDLTVELLGIDEIDGVEYYKIKIQRNGKDDFTYEYYNTKTGLLEITEKFTFDEEGNSHSAKIKITAYQTYGKGKNTMQLPAKTIMETGGPIMELETKSVVIKKKSKLKVFDGYF